MKQYLWTFLFALLKLTPSLAQVPDFTAVPNLHPGDSAGITQLINHGTRITKGKVIAWFPKDSLPATTMEKILDTLTIGIAAAERLIKVHPWQVHTKQTPYVFYFRTDRFISHASGADFVSVPFWRIKHGNAPWLHEVVHEMLNSKAGNWQSKSIPDSIWSKRMPLWLHEGIADYVSLKISNDQHLKHVDVFTNAGIHDIDSMCREDLKGKHAGFILTYIGKDGVIEELFGNNRQQYAPTFYHCACSFVKYLVERFGIDPVITSVGAYPVETKELEKHITPSITKVKESWLHELNSH